MLLSICIPSYNRGHRAYPLVIDLLNKLDKYDIEIILSNNGSNLNTEGYEKLKKIENEKFRYYEFDVNMRFWRNYNQVVKLSKGEWCLLLSDEDNINIENLEYYLDIIKNNQKISIIKAAGDDHPFDNEGEFKAGLDAIQQFFLAGNYISGTMYRRNIVSNSVIDLLAKKYEKNNEAYYYYPHLFVELIALTLGNYYRSVKRLIIKGTEIFDQEQSSSKIFKDAAYGTYESRLLQIKGFTQLISDLHASEAIKMKCFKLLIEKYIILLYICRISMRDQAVHYMQEQIKNTNSTLIIENSKDFEEYIENFCEKIL